MSRAPAGRTTTRSDLAKLGFLELTGALAQFEQLDAVCAPSGVDVSDVRPAFADAADPDQALGELLSLIERDSSAIIAVLADPDAAARLIRVLGASTGLAAFWRRNPAELAAFAEPLVDEALDVSYYVADLADAVDGLSGDAARDAMRVRYRRHLARLASWDLSAPDPAAVMKRVGTTLADLAAAALETGLTLARRSVPFPAGEVDATRLAIIGMGKAGARELNYVSDVDVIFVADGDEDLVAKPRMLDIATRLAKETMRAIDDLGIEPALWEVDANLRPEGKDGALVRTLDSHVAYYDRWAHGWEFQALLKARAMAGDTELGAEYEAAIWPFVWSATSRTSFVENVQRMRERVTDHIPPEQLDVQLKLGPGGLRDIEFTVQLLELVHGRSDESVRERGTLDALEALARGGYIGRAEAAAFGDDYRMLRVLEHRLQLHSLRRTHLMPTAEPELRALARASRMGGSADGLVAQWQRIKVSVRQQHERLFYRPLLSAVASLDDGDATLTSTQAIDRLEAIGFRDPKGALAHIGALTAGVSRRATIQRTLLPVMLQWFAQGADPDGGLLAFRRLSDELGDAYWYLRMLRDSSVAAERLTHVLSGSRFIAKLFEKIPEAAAWLEDDAELVPRSRALLLDEVDAIVSRYDEDGADGAAAVVRAMRRREILRLAIGSMVGTVGVIELGPALSDVITTTLSGALYLSHRFGDGIELGIVAMGRYGGEELGFGSDADIVYVFRDVDAGDEAVMRAERVVHSIKRLTEDLLLPLDLDLDLRPEGRNGAIVRSVDSYRAYYERWSDTWEAQALLRARSAVGDVGVLADFDRVIEDVRYPEVFDEAARREILRIKARVEAERLPQAADPKRHLKLGPGSLSDVEWLIQLWQLEHAADVPGLRTPSTLGALAAAEEAGIVSGSDAARLRDAWTLASRVRSALTLWTGKTLDLLPIDRDQLEGVARILEYPPGSTTRFEDDYLRVTRLSRQVFERLFYGE